MNLGMGLCGLYGKWNASCSRREAFSEREFCCDDGVVENSKDGEGDDVLGDGFLGSMLF